MAKSKREKKFYNTWWFWIIFAILIVFLVLSFNGSFGGNQGNPAPNIPEVTMEPIAAE
jgi:hypothetical protein